MAGPPSFLGFKMFKAWVEVDRKRLTCYAPFVDKSEKTVSCWIASEESKCFSVNLSKKKVASSIKTSLFLDGNRTSSGYLKKQELDTLIFDTVRASKTTVRPFKFAPLEITDDDKYLDNMYLSLDSVQKIGEITLELHRVTHLHYTEKPKKKKKKKKPESDLKKYSDPQDKLQVQKVHETSHKVSAVPHQIGFGEERKIERRQSPDAPDRDSDSEKTYMRVCYSDVKELIARFTFRYRPFELLKSCGIIPRSSITLQVPRLLASNEQAQPFGAQPSRDQVPPLPSNGNPPSVWDQETLQAPKGPEPRLLQASLPSDHPSVQGREAPQPLEAQSQALLETEVPMPSEPEPPSVHGEDVVCEDPPLPEDWDDIYVPLQPSNTPPTISTKTETSANNSSENSNMNIVQSLEDETKPPLSDDDYEDENDEEIKALQERTRRLLEEKRKRQEEKQGPRKRIKREEAPMVFFRPGEIQEVIDLT